MISPPTVCNIGILDDGGTADNAAFAGFAFGYSVGIVKSSEHLLNETCFMQATVEAPNVYSVNWPAEPDEPYPGCVLRYPCIERLTGEFRPMVGLNQITPPSPLTKPLQNARNSNARYRRVELAVLALGIAHVDYGQPGNVPKMRQCVGKSKFFFHQLLRGYQVIQEQSGISWHRLAIHHANL
jgi:hypothetical protein